MHKIYMMGRADKLAVWMEPDTMINQEDKLEELMGTEFMTAQEGR